MLNNSRTSVRRYARLNKNFVVNGDLARTVKAYDLSGRDLYVLISLLAEAQYKDTRHIRFASFFAILKLLRWSDRKSDYVALDSALAKWMGVRIRVEKFRLSKRDIEYDAGMLEIDPGRRKRQTSGSPYGTMAFRDILFVDEIDDCIHILFSKEFWEANGKHAGYFTKAIPGVIQQLRYPAEMLLYFLLNAFDGSLRMKPVLLCEKIGVGFRSRPHFNRRLRTALDRISEATDQIYRFHYDDFGCMVIYPGDFTDKIRNKLYGKSTPWGV